MSLLVFIFLIFAAFKVKQAKNPKFEKYLDFSSGEYILNLLFIFVLFGFLTRLDNPSLDGNMLGLDPFWKLDNILLSSFSVFLVGLAIYYRPYSFFKYLILLEFIYWLVKLFYLKAATPLCFGINVFSNFASYDYIALTLRILVLAHAFSIRLITKYIWIAPVVAILIWMAKYHFLPHPPIHKFRLELIHKNMEEERSIMLGSWNGIYKSKNKKIQDVNLKIGPTKIYFDQLIGPDSVYEYSYSYSGKLSVDPYDEHLNDDLSIKKINNDSNFINKKPGFEESSMQVKGDLSFHLIKIEANRLKIKVRNFEETYLLDLKRNLKQ